MCGARFDAGVRELGLTEEKGDGDEDGGLAEADSYGVVKVQWVDSVPYGTGFLSGGVDGADRARRVRAECVG